MCLKVFQMEDSFHCVKGDGETEIKEKCEVCTRACLVACVCFGSQLMSPHAGRVELPT